MGFPPRRTTDRARGPVAAARRLNDRTPLRIKLVGVLLLLVVAALVGSGVAATATLRGYLVDRVDTQLESAARGIGEHGLERGTEPEGDHALPSAFVVELTDASGRVVYGPTGNLVDAGQPLPTLPRPTYAETVAGHRSFTVPAVSGPAQWRVFAVPVQLSGGGQGTLMVAQSLGDVQSTVSRLALLLAVIGGAALVVLAGVGYVVVRASLRPLRDVERTAAAIAAGDLSQRVATQDPRTEVGQLSLSLNGMLAQIESAFAQRAASERAARRSEERMRRFVADASHELRTPLTSIRGFAELYRQGAATAPDDVSRLMRRIEDEAARMGVLVDDLLLLARLDQQRPLEQKPVDLLVLVGDAVHDARAVAPDRDIELEIGTMASPPVVMGDEVRLRQVLGNLVGNALRHTPPGSQVRVRLATAQQPEPQADIVVLEVADQGPGMTSEDAARVFERFYRTDTSRNRVDGGAGLGLAIVSALVTGHAGTVEVDTAPGHGATFRVKLPLAPVSVQPA